MSAALRMRRLHARHGLALTGYLSGALLRPQDDPLLRYLKSHVGSWRPHLPWPTWYLPLAWMYRPHASRIPYDASGGRCLENYLPVIYKIAKQHRGCLDLCDAVGFGNLELMLAAYRYIPVGNTLSIKSLPSLPTFAWRRVIGEIRDQAAIEREHGFRQAVLQPDQEDGADLDDEAPDERPALETRVDNQLGTGAPGGPIADQRSSTFGWLLHIERTAVFRVAVSRLEWPERHVIDMRFGLDGGDGLTRKEVAGRLWKIDRLVVDQEQVRQIELRALKRLRKYLHAKKRPPRQPYMVPLEQPCEHTFGVDGKPWPFSPNCNAPGVQGTRPHHTPHKRYPFAYTQKERKSLTQYVRYCRLERWDGPYGVIAFFVLEERRRWTPADVKPKHGDQTRSDRTGLYIKDARGRHREVFWPPRGNSLQTATDTHRCIRNKGAVLMTPCYGVEPPRKIVSRLRPTRRITVVRRISALAYRRDDHARHGLEDRAPSAQADPMAGCDCNDNPLL